TVNAGTLALTALSNSNNVTVASGANLVVTGTSPNALPSSTQLAANGAVIFSAAQQLANLSGGSAGSVDLSAGGGVTLTLSGGSFAGNISGAGGSLTVNSSGTVTLTGNNNNYTGGTNIN